MHEEHSQVESDANETPPIVTARPAGGWVYARPATPPNPLLLPGVDVRRAWLNLVLVFVVCVLTPGASALLLWVESDGAALERIEFSGVAVTWLRFLVVATLAGYFVLRGDCRPEMLGLTARRLGRQLLWSPAIIAMMYGSMLAIGMALLAVSGAAPAGEEIRRRFEFAEALPTESFTLTITLLTAVACYEELLFRGLLVPLLRRVSGSWTIAIACSSLMFGLLHFHQGVMAIVQITGLAVVLAVAFVATRSLAAVIVAHFLFDLLQFQLVRFLITAEP
ncbi:MAG: CPBP family intramembrane metalloprotease [Planctomycetota bacterium]|nr:MAG: CPBP family intramembrane metalloprotease [Planctomycetota bacterium]